MMEALLTISLLHWVVLVTPGVNFVLLAQLAVSGRRSTAAMAVAGITTATLAWATLAVGGVGVIFVAHPAVRLLAQIAGGGYLLYVAWRLWRSKASSAGEVPAHLTLGSAFRLGFVTNMLNPKPALFFGSVFVTTLPAHAGSSLIASAVAMVYINAVLWHLFLVVAFSVPKVKRGYERFSHIFNRAASVLVAAFGLKLVWATVQEFRSTDAT
jgi:threonine efflux protein